MQEEELSLYKIVLAGETKSGKTCILARFTGNVPRENENSTIGVEFGVRVVKNNIMHGKLQLWDTAGQQRFRAISAAYYRGCRVIVFVFDVSNRESFVRLNTWLEEGKQHGSDARLIIVGNKIGLPNRQVSTAEAESFALENQASYIEVDAMDNTNMDEAFDLVCETAVNGSDNVPIMERKTSEADEKWKAKLLPLLQQVHDLKFHSIYQIYSPIIKLSAPRLLDSYIQDEVFRVTTEQTVWQKILNNVQLGVREELNLDEISQVLQIAIISECSSLKKYALAQLARRINREKMTTVLPYLVNASFMNEDHKKAVLQYVYQLPVPSMQTNKIREAISPEVFEDYQIWKSKEKTISPLLEVDSEAEQKQSCEDRFFAITAKLYSERDTSGDLQLKSGGAEESNPAFMLKVHRLVAAARCDYINSCLNSHLKEAGEGVIEIKGFTKPELSALVEYFYTNSFAHITEPDMCISILSMAAYLMLTKETNSSVNHSELLRVLEKTVLDNITDETCLDLAVNAHKSQDEALKKMVITYITEHYYDVTTKYEDQFTKLPKALMFAIMNRVILKLGGNILNHN